MCLTTEAILNKMIDDAEKGRPVELLADSTLMYFIPKEKLWKIYERKLDRVGRKRRGKLIFQHPDFAVAYDFFGRYEEDQEQLSITNFIRDYGHTDAGKAYIKEMKQEE